MARSPLEWRVSELERVTRAIEDRIDRALFWSITFLLGFVGSLLIAVVVVLLERA